MDVHVADHPLIAHKLTYLRDKRTDTPTFRRLAEELVTLLAYEATRDVRVEPFEIETPVAPTTGIKLSNPKPLIVPILRAGLGMLDGMVRLLPDRRGGLPRHDPQRGDPRGLHLREPPARRPHRSTGLRPRPDARHRRHARRRRSTTSPTKGARDITAVCLLAAPEGIEHLEDELSDSDIPVKVVLGTIDEKLNEKGYIVPGLGDAGDRLYGVV